MFLRRFGTEPDSGVKCLLVFPSRALPRGPCEEHGGYREFGCFWARLRKGDRIEFFFLKKKKGSVVERRDGLGRSLSMEDLLTLTPTTHTYIYTPPWEFNEDNSRKQQRNNSAIASN